MFGYILLLSVATGICFGDEFIELNHNLDPIQSRKFKTDPLFILENVPKESALVKEDQWLADYKFCIPEHFATHVDAPYHFYEKGWTVDEIPLDRLIVPAVVIDIRDKVKKNNIYELSVADVAKWSDQYGPFPNYSVVLVNTGWDQRYHISMKAYYGHETNPSHFAHPGVSLSAARALVGLKESTGLHIVGVGIDGPSLDSLWSINYPTHREFAAANIYLLENLKDVHKVPPIGAELTVMPMKIKGGSGGPSRVVARIHQCSGSVCGMSSLFLIVSCLFVLSSTNSRNVFNEFQKCVQRNITS